MEFGLKVTDSGGINEIRNPSYDIVFDKLTRLSMFVRMLHFVYFWSDPITQPAQ